MAKKTIKREGTHKLRSGRFVVREDYEARPSVRFIYEGRANFTSGSNPVRQFAYKVLAQVQQNIRTQLNGRWTPIQWGPKAGTPALLKGVDEWTVTRYDTKTYRVQPKREFRKKWRGHIGGMLIKPRQAKALRFVSYDGDTLLRPWVKLPKRDPRPTESQLRRL